MMKDQISSVVSMLRWVEIMKVATLVQMKTGMKNVRPVIQKVERLQIKIQCQKFVPTLVEVNKGM